MNTSRCDYPAINLGWWRLSLATRTTSTTASATVYCWLKPSPNLSSLSFNPPSHVHSASLRHF